MPARAAITVSKMPSRSHIKIRHALRAKRAVTVTKRRRRPVTKRD
jgi:hypothetical protein